MFPQKAHTWTYSIAQVRDKRFVTLVALSALLVSGYGVIDITLAQVFLFQVCIEEKAIDLEELQQY